MAAEGTLRQVGRYEILSAIGRGGMGAVYRARIRGPADATRVSALKVIHDHLAADQSFVLMFLDEMRIAMGLTHRNVIQTFDAGHEGDLYFMVMELCEGWSLAEILTRLKGPLPIDLAVFIGMEVASALDYAHTLRPAVVHRDVSPANILISTRGDVKLTDFGVAKAARRLTVTSADVLKGKLGYMAPEQARGQAEAASDLFALGAVLYEMASGQRIRRQSDIDSVIHGTIPPLRRVARVPIPPDLERLITACLSPTIAERPRTAAVLRESLLKQHFAIQAAGGQPLDSHRRLEAFLAERVGPPETGPEPVGADPPSDREGRLARAILAQAGSEEEDASRSARRPAPRLSTLPMETGAPDLTDGQLTTPVATRSSLAGTAGQLTTPVFKHAPPAATGAQLTTPVKHTPPEATGAQLTTPVERVAPLSAVPTPAVTPSMVFDASPSASPSLVDTATARVAGRRRGAVWLLPVAGLFVVGAGLAVGIWVRSGGSATDRAASAQDAAPPAAVAPLDGARPGRERSHDAASARLDRPLIAARADLRAQPPVAVDRRPGSLWVLARLGGRVVWADIYVDGKRVGQSPLRVPRVPSGVSPQVEARREGYPAVARRARLKPGQELKLFLDLDRR